MANASAVEEFRKLARSNVSEYVRSHELLAFDFFMSEKNPFRVTNCKDAEFEYIPLLPLHWIASKTNSQQAAFPAHCSYSALVEDIVAYMNYLKSFKTPEQLKAEATTSPHDRTHPRSPIRFAVASTFNLRTELGTGMPTQQRRGDIYDTVTSFVTTLSIGHYERWPQCPDLLRKSWKSVVELPYVPAFYDRSAVLVGSTAAVQLDETTRDISFLFAGRLLLWGPERVCSVRNFVMKLAARADTVIVNVSEAQYLGVPNGKVRELMHRSIFCLILKADSYSTSFFYSALHAGCVPIVISDWFVFAFPWAIKYEEFTVRVLEEDFMKNPMETVDWVDREYLHKNKNEKLTLFQSNMKKWLPLLGFDEVDIDGGRYGSLKSALFEGKSDAPLSRRSITRTVIPFELMMYELRYVQMPESVHRAVPCYGPFTCTWNSRNLQEIAGPFNPKVKTNIFAAGGGFVKLTENRTHLCRNSPRLIGHYKIVYFMQCVRILWPLTPGKVNKLDVPPTSAIDKAQIVYGTEGVRDEVLKRTQLDSEDLQFIMNFHALTNISKLGKWQWTTYPLFEEEKLVATINP
jgi:hypothetical protein